MKNIDKHVSCCCGQTGNTSLNMLECTKCRRWYHEECVKCLDLPMLVGDRFYIFICSFCNAGSEYLARLEMNWEEVTHLLLYNLTILEKKKYFHLDKSMIPFLQHNWERFHPYGEVATEKDVCRTKVLHALESSHNRFKCGKEVKKCKNIWALRVRIVPDAPSVLPSAARLKKDVVVWDFKVEDRAYHVVPRKRSTKSTKVEDNLKNSKSKSKSIVSSSDCHKDGEVSKCRGSLPHSENGLHKTKQKNKRTIPLFNEKTAQLGLLDSLIPCPPDFKGCNNPFLKSYKRFNLKRPYSQISKTSSSNSKRKRVENSFINNETVLNGNHHSSEDSSKERCMFLKTKDNLQKPGELDFCIMGKRVTSNGKIQYLTFRNR